MALQEISKNESEGHAKESEDLLHQGEYIAEVNKEKLKGGQGSKIGGVLAGSVVGATIRSPSIHSLHHMVRFLIDDFDCHRENVNQDLEAFIDSFNKICAAHLEEKSAKVP